ncbi:hypothetical protein PINS_up015162 [Pythium insidiosum]|nr:hypothetical protein PINS_up015162 [Pythium insidiosum]
MTGSAQKTPFHPLQHYVSAKDVAHARLGTSFTTNNNSHSSSNDDPSRRLGSASSYSDDRLGRSLAAVASPSSFSAASPRCSTPSGDPEYTLKVVLIGDSGVGKSNLVLRFAKNRFNAKSQQTVGFEFATKSIRVGDRRLKAQLWDSSGQDRFQSLTAAYYRNAVGAMVVYDITNRATFESATKWLAQIHEHCHESLVTILVGNKCDLAHLPKLAPGVDARGCALRRQARHGVCRDVGARRHQRHRCLQEDYRSRRPTALAVRQPQQRRAASCRMATSPLAHETRRVLVRKPVHQRAHRIRTERSRQAVAVQLSRHRVDQQPRQRHCHARKPSASTPESVSRATAGTSMRRHMHNLCHPMTDETLNVPSIYIFSPLTSSFSLHCLRPHRARALSFKLLDVMS